MPIDWSIDCRGVRFSVFARFQSSNHPSFHSSNLPSCHPAILPIFPLVLIILLATLPAIGQDQQEDRQETDRQAPQEEHAPTAKAESQELSPQSATTVQGEVDDDETRLEMVRRQVEVLLTAAGLPTDQQCQDSARQLEEVADVSHKLAASLPERRRLEARQIEMQANYALAQRARTVKKNREAGYRVGQLRNAALQSRQLKSPAATAMADFWLMQADLFDLNSTTLPVDVRQVETIKQLEQFVREHKISAGERRRNGRELGKKAAPPRPLVDPTHQAILTDVKLALLRLYDQRGQSHKACPLLEQLHRRAIETSNEPLAEKLDRMYGYCDTLWAILDAQLHTANGKIWSARQQHGHDTLIHFWAGWFAPSVEAFDALDAARRQHHDRGLEVLSVNLDNLDPSNVDLADWAVCHDGPGPRKLAEMFAVRSLPRYVLINAKGQVVAVGGSLAILEQLDSPIDDAGANADSAPVTKPPAK